METKIHNRFYDRLTADNAALLLVDHQLGLFTGIRDIDIAQLKHNVVGLAKAAKVLGIPTIVTTTSRDSLWGPTIPELTEVLSGVEIIDRTTVNAWDESRIVKAIAATGRCDGLHDARFVPGVHCGAVDNLDAGQNLGQLGNRRPPEAVA